MIEFQEFPKMIYHPKDKDVHVIVRSADEESDQLEAWGVEADAPKIPLRSDGAPKPKAAPKAKAPRARKAAN